VCERTKPWQSQAKTVAKPSQSRAYAMTVILPSMSRTAVARTTIERAGSARARSIRQAVATDVQRAREDSGLSLRRLARAAGVSVSTVHALERGTHDPSTEVLARIGAALGMDLSVRLYLGTGPLIRDHLQAAMIEALLGLLDERWRPSPEVPLQRPVRGVIDLVLDTPEELLIACEAQSDLRRLEQQLRWSQAKADALAQARGRPVSRLLLLRSTRRTRAIVGEFADTIGAAFPTPAADAYGALAGTSTWAGDALLWCDVARGKGRALASSPRGVTAAR